MRASVTQLTQSQYFSPIFNTAVFDGPVRIYFSQKQEAYALELYFKLSSRLRSSDPEAMKRRFPNVFVMIHPDSASYFEAFDSAHPKFCSRKLGSDMVVGVNGPLLDSDLEEFILHVLEILELHSDLQRPVMV